MLNNNFFKFLFGFIAIIGISLIVVFVTQAYSSSDADISIIDLIASFFR